MNTDLTTAHRKMKKTTVFAKKAGNPFVGLRHLFPLLIVACLMPASMQAQLQGNVAVEGDYLKDVYHPEKVNVLPTKIALELPETTLPYSLEGVDAPFTPFGQTLPPTIYTADTRLRNQKGYLDLSMGSWLNTTLYAGYKPIDTKRDRLNLRLCHLSTSLWRPYGLGSHRKYSYHEGIAADYTHLFSDKGNLDLSLQYAWNSFNYYGILPQAYTRPGSHPWDPGYVPDTYPRPKSQTLNDLSLRAQWRPELREADHHWSLGLEGGLFSYFHADSEMRVSADGEYDTKISDRSRAGISGRADFLWYSCYNGAPTSGLTAESEKPYFSFKLNPHYTFRRSELQIRLGLHADFCFNAKGNVQGEDYRFFHAAPDVRADITAKNTTFYLNVLGGTQLNTLAYTYTLDPYQAPYISSTQPSHTPLDARLGFSLRPFTGFEASLEARYTSTKNVPMGGWYMWQYSGQRHPLERVDMINFNPEYDSGGWRYNLSGFGAFLTLGWSPSKIFKIKAGGSYTPQREESGIFNGLDRPRWIVESSFELHPIDKLTVGVGYQYRGVRHTYYPLKAENAFVNGSALHIVRGMRLPDISLLSASVKWNFSPKFSIGVSAENLLNSKTLWLPDTPGQGTTISGNLAFIF